MYSVSNLMKMHYRDISCLARKLGLPGNLKKSILVSAIALYNSGKRNEADKIILDAKVMRYKKCRSSIGKNSKTIRMNRSMISSGKNHRSPQFCINEPRYTMPPPFIPIGLFDDSDSSNLHVRTFYSSTPTLDSSESNDNDIFDLSNSPHPLTPIPSTSPIINRRNWYPPTTRQQIYMQPFSSYSNAGIYTDPQFMYPYTQRTTTMGNYNEHRLSQSNMHSFEFYATDLMVGQNTSSTDGTCTASFVTNSQFYYGRHLSVMQNCPANLLPAVPQLTADNVPSQILSNVESANISSLSENQSNEGRLSEISENNNVMLLLEEDSFDEMLRTLNRVDFGISNIAIIRAYNLILLYNGELLNELFNLFSESDSDLRTMTTSDDTEDLSYLLENVNGEKLKRFIKELEFSFLMNPHLPILTSEYVDEFFANESNYSEN